ncbi:MAG TPA: hypothetical protein V6C72_08315, partial [Chroococcales cyanobacterium]
MAALFVNIAGAQFPCFSQTAGPQAHVVKYGAWVKPAVFTPDGHEQALLDFQRQTQGKPAIAHYYIAFNADLGSEAAWALSKGMIPMVSMHCGKPTDVNRGAYDNYFKKFGQQIKACGGPVLFRYGFEMDNAHVEPDAGTPQQFKAAWQRVHTLIKDTKTGAGATNCEFVFCPTAEGYKLHADLIKQMYPGAPYTYFIACDGYNRTQPNGRSAKEIFASFLSVANELDSSKSLLIGETGTVGTDQQKADWLKDLGDWAKTTPRMWAVCYW